MCARVIVIFPFPSWALWHFKGPKVVREYKTKCSANRLTSLYNSAPMPQPIENIKKKVIAPVNTCFSVSRQQSCSMGPSLSYYLFFCCVCFQPTQAYIQQAERSPRLNRWITITFSSWLRPISNRGVLTRHLYGYKKRGAQNDVVWFSPPLPYNSSRILVLHAYHE